MKHLNVLVKGKVQGVYFRASTKAVADQLGVKGFVLNQPDGTVYLEAEGDAMALDFLLDFCNEGPYDAEVEAVEVIETTELKHFKNFEVIKKIK
ncbi:acylphosphatase [Sphingobacterium sp.]|uniref:acylphosphatase n=1 Tax=Sphingobacterium sp. TaxID=341027 RepID=UPI00289C9E38|nr:acylphosphatase [Sphingobacterium sp.]